MTKGELKPTLRRHPQCVDGPLARSAAARGHAARTSRSDGPCKGPPLPLSFYTTPRDAANDLGWFRALDHNARAKAPTSALLALALGL